MSQVKDKSDEEIVVLVRTNRDLYAEIIKRYQEKLTRYTTYLVGDYHQASDIVQETFIKAFKNLNGFDARKKFSSWIYRIAHNETMNIIKKNKKTVSLETQVDFDSGINLEEELLKKELVEHAHECLALIPVIYREPLSLYYLEERSYEEIGDILKLPVGTVGTRINRAKIMMKKICQK